MDLPANDAVKGFMKLPWGVEVGTLPDGTRFARCVEISHAVAYAEPGENLETLFWDSVQASLEAMLASGEPIPTPRAIRGQKPERVILVNAEYVDAQGEIATVETDRVSWGVNPVEVDRGALTPLPA